MAAASSDPVIASPGPRYIGRFAPSPTGPLHAGSLVAALASWLDARAHGGRWLVRIEDVDTPRCQAGADDIILRQLADCGLLPDEAPWHQSRRGSAYAAALDSLLTRGLAYPCDCTRREVDEALLAAGVTHTRHVERVYPGTCRPERGGPRGRERCAVRLRSDQPTGQTVAIDWHDRRLGAQHQDITHTMGDFVLHRADGLWAYQLAVVVDDAEQGITDVVRGEDLTDNTPRQIWLQRCLGHPTPRYLHTPLVRDAGGEKLSKQHGAAPLDTREPLPLLQTAGITLGLPAIDAASLPEWLAAAVQAWPWR